MTTINLKATSIIFLSSGDEDSFFRWLNSIDCVSNFKGVRDVLSISVDMEKLNDENLRELVALFSRYDCDLRQLSQFLNDDNRHWFADPRKSWHASIFGI